jgi:hypothetical protein
MHKFSHVHKDRKSLQLTIYVYALKFGLYGIFVCTGTKWPLPAVT